MDTIIGTANTPKAEDESQMASRLVTATASLENVDSHHWMVELEFLHTSGKRVRQLFGREILVKPLALDEELMKRGAILHEDTTERKEMLKELRNQIPTTHRRITRRAGWHDDAFVLPKATYGERRDIIFDLTDEEKSWTFGGAFNGNLEAWKAGLKEPVSRSSYLAFGLSVACTAPVAALVDIEETAIFHLFGQSNTGKTLAGKVCTSVAGKARKRDLLSFRHTNVGAEDAVSRWSGTGVVIDEIEEFEGDAKDLWNHIKSLGHSLTGGSGKVRSDYSRRQRELAHKDWWVFGLTTGELSLEQIAAKAKTRRNSGHQKRYIDLPLPTRERGGCFDRLGASTSARQGEGKRLAGLVARTIRRNYGCAIGPYIDYILKDQAGVKREFVRLSELFAAKCAPEEAWEHRFALKFGYVYAGGILGVRAGLIPCNELHIRRSAIRLYKRARGAIKASTQLNLLALSTLFQSFDDQTRFPTVNKKQEFPSKLKHVAFGFRRKTTDLGDFIGLDPKIARRWCVTPDAHKALLNDLLSQSILVPESEGNATRAHKVLGIGRRRYLTLDYLALQKARQSLK